MSDEARGGAVAEAIEDFHRRRALGEAVDPDSYRERLGASHAEFLSVLRAGNALDEGSASAGTETLPRPFGPYTLLRVLGRGAAGVVYEAVHRDLGRRAALKVLRTGFDTEPTALERFRREARACSQVHHDHIVEIYEMGEAEGRPYYAMELLPGAPLSDVIAAGKVPPSRALFAAMAGVADALHALHEVGVVHRDVKPSNVMVRPDGRMVLADFGLARTPSTVGLTQTGEALGTPLYMSPEQILGQRGEVDARTDVYGLGATLYEALTGRSVFQADDVATLLRMILFQRPDAPSAVAPTVPPEAENVVLKAIEKRREDRYPTAASMRDDLLAFAAGRPVEGRPVPAAVRFARGVRRRAVPIALVAVLLAVGAYLWSRRTGRVTLESVPPGAEVLLDGALLGATPIGADLAPGSYAVTFRHEGFEAQPRTLEIGPGDKHFVEVALRIADPDDEKALALLGSAVGIRAPRATKADPAPAVRGVVGVRDGPALEAVFPRGDVRLEDLDVAALDVAGARPPASGRVEFRKGSVLASVPVTIDRTWIEVPIPEEVRGALRPGDEGTWQFLPDDPAALAAAPASAAFRVVDRGSAADLAGLTKRLGPQPAPAMAVLRNRWLVSEGLATAALRDALRAVRADAKNRRGWAAVGRALDAMALGESALAADARAAARGASPPSLKRILR